MPMTPTVRKLPLMPNIQDSVMITCKRLLRRLTTDVAGLTAETVAELDFRESKLMEDKGFSTEEVIAQEGVEEQDETLE